MPRPECIPVLLTPFHKDLSLDVSSLNSLLDFYYRKGIRRLWVLGTGAEDMSLPFSLRVEVVKHVTQFKNNYFKSMVGTSFYSLDESLNFLDFLNSIDIHSVHYMPYNRLISDQVIENIYKIITSRSDHPVYAYTSANWTKTFLPQFVDSIKTINGICGIKYSTSNIVHTEKVLSLSSSEFEVIPAVVKQLLPSLVLGATSFTTVEASIFLDKINLIVDQFADNNLAAARQSQRELNLEIAQSSLSPSSNNFLRNAEIKSILEHRNICKRWVAREYMDVSDDEFSFLSAFV